MFYKFKHQPQLLNPESVIKLFILTIFFLPSNLNASDYDYTENGIYYKILSSDSNNPTLEVINPFVNNLQFPFTDITIPQYVEANNTRYKVISIGNDTFSYSYITTINLPNSITQIGKYAFYFCSDLQEITLPNSLLSIQEYTFGNCHALSKIHIPNTVTEIKENAFCHCNNLKTIDLPSSLSTIGRGAFFFCTGLESIIIPNSVETIGEYVFSECHSLHSIQFPSSISAIPEGMCFACSELSKITIPNTVTSIGQYAFQGCEHLMHWQIPSSITNIGKGAFYNISNIIDIYCEWNTPIVCEDLYAEQVYQNAILYVPTGTLSSYQSIYPWNQFKNIKEYENSAITDVKTDNAFSVTIENNSLKITNYDMDNPIEIYDTLGHCLYYGKNAEITNLPSGLCIVRIGNSIQKVRL